MSRIGNMPILIPTPVTVQKTDGEVVVGGPKGELKMKVPVGILVDMKNQEVLITRKSEESKVKALHGLTRSLIANMVVGVTEGWSKNLELVGVGYRAETDGNKLILNIGFSHPVEVIGVEGIRFEVKDNTSIVIVGIDKEKVGQAAAKIRNIKPPEPYKGKGIRYAGEYIKKKVGKTGKVGVGGAK